MITIDEFGWQLFCFNRIWEPKYQPLSEGQQKVYNMRKAGFSVEAIATRMNRTVTAVRSQITEIRAKGVKI